MDRMGDIHSEQVQLLKVEKQLNISLNKISVAINALKVEELQLQSNEVDALRKANAFMSAQTYSLQRNAPQLLTVSESCQNETTINKQEMDLEIAVCNEENDSD